MTPKLAQMSFEDWRDNRKRGITVHVNDRLHNDLAEQIAQ